MFRKYSSLVSKATRGCCMHVSLVSLEYTRNFCFARVLIFYVLLNGLFVANIRFVSSISFFYAKLLLSPSQRYEAPFRAYALARATNSTRLFIPGECKHSKMQSSSMVRRLSLHYVISTRAICSIMSAVECPCSALGPVFRIKLPEKHFSNAEKSVFMSSVI